MLQNYLCIAFRQLLRNKAHTLINLFGLGIGLAVSLMLLVHIKKELSYETAYPHHERIYRLASTHWAKMSPLLAERLEAEIPGVQFAGRIFDAGPKILEHDEVQIATQNNFFADQSIIDIFSLEFILGNPEGALEAPYTVILSEKTAQRLFGKDSSPIGRTVRLDGYREYTVTGVIRELPAYSHLQADLFVSTAASPVTGNDSKVWAAVATYALFESVEAAEKASRQMKDFQANFMEGRQTREEIDQEGDFFELHPITEIHLHSQREKELSANGDIIYIYVFSVLALLILLVACINFINLFTAQSLKRGREIGVRKAIGAGRGQLVRQFLGESLFTSLCAALLALGIIVLSLPWYNQLAAVPINVEELFSLPHLLMFAAVVLLVSLLSGIYPALHITRFSINQSLKNHLATGRTGRFNLRKGLLSLQFFVSLLIMTCSLAVYLQLTYLLNKDLGFEKEGVVAVQLHSNLWWQTVNHPEKVRNEMLSIEGVESMSTTSKLPGERFGWESLQLQGSEEESVSVRYLRTDEEFINTMNIRLLAGHDFRKTADSTSQWLINEKAAEYLHSDQLIGQAALNTVNGYEGKIVGIVEDFHFASLHQEVEPLVVEYRPNNPNYLLLRIASGDLKESIEKVEAKMAEISPATLFVFQFLDDQLAALYETENKLLSIFRVFAGLSLLIACLGLFALATHSVEARSKEIGIRKVIGASVSDIWLLFSVSYMKVMIITFLLAVPVANYLITEWLQNFAYRVEISWWLYALPALLMLLFALATISSQTLKAARQNPVASLRDE